MSSGEKAKPPTTFEERNPFDISRNSGPEVASEIAKRMAAWKQARARANAAPMTQPATTQSGIISSGDAKPPPIAAPVLPARMPKAARGSQPPQATPATASAGSAAPRVPYFAVSATRRAMPPAPSPKTGSVRPPASEGDERAVRAEDSTIMPPAPERERASPDQVERPPQPADVASTPEPTAVAASTIVPAAIDETIEQPTPAQAEPSDAHPFESALAAEASEPSSAEPDERERRHAEARAIKERWIAARDLDVLLESPGASSTGIAQAVDAAEARARDAGTPARDADPANDASPLVGRLHGAETDIIGWSTEEHLRDVASGPDSASEAAAQVDEPATPTVPMAGSNLEPPESQTVPIAALDEAVGRSEPTLDASGPVVSQTTPAADRAVERQTQALDIAALDEMAGRKEPTFDTPIARTVPETRIAKPEPSDLAPDEIVAPPRVDSGAGEAPALTTEARDAADEQRVLSIAALDAVAGRKEPTFDPPIRPAAAGRSSEAQDEAARAPIARATAEAVMPAPVESGREPSVGSVQTLDETAGRKEPTFDESARPAIVAPAPVSAQKAAPPIKLRPIETRIEARRVDMLRADSQMSPRRPIFPHIEPEEWHVPPTFAARANRERPGTSWAIGLGSLLLIAGITAPAAIWQQGRQAEDQAALVMPAPATQQTAATTGVPGATPAPAPAQATQPAAPQPATPQPEAPSSGTTPPAVMAQQPSAPAPAEATSGAEKPAPSTPPATTLSAIGKSDDVNEAPIVAPPPPMVNLASKTVPAATGTPMVARPFVPEQGDGPFLRPPTTGAASVPVGTPQPGAKPVETGVKPNLIGLLKPRATAVATKSKPASSKPRTVQRQPKPFFQQSPDQMFNTLIETLSEGRPVNPKTKPASPSTRR